MVLPKSMGSWQPNGHCVQSSERPWFHVVSSFHLIHTYPPFCPSSHLDPTAETPRKQKYTFTSCSATSWNLSLQDQLAKETGKDQTSHDWELVGKEMGEGEITLWFSSSGYHMPGTVWGCRRHSNSKECVRETLVTHFEDYRPYQWDYWRVEKE